MNGITYLLFRIRPWLWETPVLRFPPRTVLGALANAAISTIVAVFFGSTLAFSVSFHLVFWGCAAIGVRVAEHQGRLIRRRFEADLREALAYVRDHQGEVGIGRICGYTQLWELERRGIIESREHENGQRSYRITTQARLEMILEDM